MRRREFIQSALVAVPGLGFKTAEKSAVLDEPKADWEYEVTVPEWVLR